MTQHRQILRPTGFMSLGLGLAIMLGCVSDQGSDLSPLNLKDPRSADPFDVVDCLLPGQIRQLGTQVTYVTARRPIRTTAEDCAIRGGEYVALDRADYGTAMKVWMSAAQGGDPDAQYYVGVLYEKGAEGQPNFSQAASWYEKAAERGISRAAVNLGRLYEQGLGVEKNEGTARAWYAKASGLREGKASGHSDDGGKPLSDEARKQEGQVEGLQQELAAARTRLTERASLLDEERQTLERLKTEATKVGAKSSTPAQASPATSLVNQERVVKEREKEIATLQQQVSLLKETAKRQVTHLQTAPTQDLGLSGPTIQIVDPLVVLTRGIRVEQGRIPVTIDVSRQSRLSGRVTAPAGLRSLTVNGQQAVTDEQGMFVVSLSGMKASPRGFPIDLLAVDAQNKQGSMKLIVMTPDGVARAGEEEVITTTGFGQYHALVIGNDHYRQWAPLNTPIADATAVAALLKDRYGFQVTLLKDGTRKDILKALNELRKTLTERDQLLIYYAGHGFLEPSIDRGYWIPIEGDLQDNSEWIEFPAITDLLQLIPAKQVLVVADSCFAGKLTRSALGHVGSEVADQSRQGLLRELGNRKIRTALTSGGAKPVLDDGGAGHSVFATAFLKVLTDNATALETERLYWAVRAHVVQTAERLKFEQVPTYAPIHMAGHEGLGDFVFVPTGKRF
ncbi:MAG: caspase family protein [Nitrospirota bacterium]